MKLLLFFLMCTLTVASHAYWGKLKKPLPPVHTLPAQVISFDEYIRDCPYPITEGFMTEGQKKQFNKKLKNYENIHSILEIGFNAGHSAENFFEHCPNLETFLSVDIWYHPYAPYAAHYFQNTYHDRFIPLIGNSLQTIPEYHEEFPNIKFDLIFIDGNHAYEYCLQDILNCYRLAHEKTHLWIDDYHDQNVKAATQAALDMGVIEIENIYTDKVENRIWVEAHYLL